MGTYLSGKLESIKKSMKNQLKNRAPGILLTLAVATFIGLTAGRSHAQVVIGGWQGAGAEGWTDWGNGLSIFDPSNANKYSIVSGAVPGYSQSLQVAQAGYNQNLSLKMEYTAGDVAAFLTNNTLSFTFSVPACTNSGYSQIYSVAINASGYGFNGISWTNFTATGATNNNQSGMPNYYFTPGANNPERTQIVTYNYSSILPLITATPTSGYIELIFTSNNGSGAPTNFFINNVTLSTGPTNPPTPVTNYIVDAFDPAGVSIVTNGPGGYVTNTYSYSGGQIGAVWTNWYGSAWIAPNTWDGNAGAPGSTPLGSMLITANFDNEGDTQFAVFDNFDGIYFGLNGLALTSFQCDVRFDGGSPTTVNGSVTNYGHLQFGTRSVDYQSQDYFGSVEVPVGNTNWVHVNIPINAATDTNLLSIKDVIFKIDGLWYNAPLLGTMKLWVDNIKFVGPAGYTTPPPPTLSKLQSVVPALRIFAGTTTETYDRQNIATVSQSASWVNNNPSTISVTFSNFPIANQGYEFHIFLIPTNTLPSGYNGNPYGNTFVDWDAPVVAALRIVGNSTNVSTTFSYKTNLAGGNPNIVLANIGGAGIGTWSLRFNSATSMTLTPPAGSGSATNFSMDSASAAYFSNPLVAYFGVQPNVTTGEGQYVDVTEINVGPAGVDDHFSADSALDSGTWTPIAVSTNSIWIAGTGTGGKYWLNWTIPDIGFGLEESTNLAGGTGWVLPSFFNGHTQSPVQLLEGNARWALIPTNCVPPNPKSLFFVLRNPPVTN